jgi:septum formation topological specificity factor MinE
MSENESLRKELLGYIDKLVDNKEVVPKEFLECIDRFVLLDNDTLVFLSGLITQHDLAILAINIILKARRRNNGQSRGEMASGSAA